MLFLKNCFNKGLHHKANDAYSINETSTKNDTDTIIVDSNIENEIHHLVPALSNNSPTKKCKLETPPVFRQSRSQFFNQDIVKRSNLIKIFKLNKLCKVFNNISDSDFLSEMDIKALSHLILSCL